MNPIETRLTFSETCGLTAASAPALTLLASRVLPQTALLLWAVNHSYKVVLGSAAMASLVLALAAHKRLKGINERWLQNMLGKQLLLTAPPRQAAPRPVVTWSLLKGALDFVPIVNPTFFGPKRATVLLADYPHSDRPTLDVTPHAPPAPQRPTDLKDVLRDYVRTHGTILTENQALEMAREGGKLCEDILQGKAVDPSVENAQKLIWHFVVCQIIKEGEASEEWMWKIEDAEGRLTTFFQHVEGCQGRLSSHFKGLSVGPHMGFDVDRSVTPAAKGHVLVTALDPAQYGGKRFLALKPENYGLSGVNDTFMHSVEFVQARYRKLWPEMDEAPGWRKEHIPARFRTDAIHRMCQLGRPVEGYSDIAFRDGNEVIVMAGELIIDYAQWETSDPLDSSFIYIGLPQTKERIRPTRQIPLPTLVSDVQRSLATREASNRQIARDLNGGIAIDIGGMSFSGNTAEGLLQRLEGQLNLTPELARKTANLLTQACMPDIAQAVGINAPFAGEDPEEFLLSRDEGSRRVIQGRKGLQFSVTRRDRELKVVAQTAFAIVGGEQRPEVMHVTLEMDPLSGKSHYVIDLEGTT